MKLSKFAVLAQIPLIRAYAGSCQTLQIPVNISTTNLNITLPAPQNNSELIAATQGQLSLGGQAGLAAFVAGVMPVQGQFSISTTFCSPSAGNHSSTLLMLVHGLGFDKSYWSPNIENETYSFVAAAGAQGYSTLAFDLLGAGNSSRPDDGTNIVQTNTNTDVVRRLLYAVRNGTTGFSGNLSFDHIVGIGLGTGATVLANLLNQTSDALDGTILSGFSHNVTGTFAFTGTVQPVIANTVTSQFASNLSSLPNDYLIYGSSYGTLVYYLYQGGYPASLGDLMLRNLQPFTIGQEFTLNTLPIMATTYSGPLLLMNGEKDLLFCAGACTGEGYDILAAEKPYFASSTFSTFAVPDAGLVINYHYSAPKFAFPKMLSWLAQNSF